MSWRSLGWLRQNCLPGSDWCWKRRTAKMDKSEYYYIFLIISDYFYIFLIISHYFNIFLIIFLKLQISRSSWLPGPYYTIPCYNFRALARQFLRSSKSSGCRYSAHSPCFAVPFAWLDGRWSRGSQPKAPQRWSCSGSVSGTDRSRASVTVMVSLIPPPKSPEGWGWYQGHAPNGGKVITNDYIRVFLNTLKYFSYYWVFLIMCHAWTLLWYTRVHRYITMCLDVFPYNTKGSGNTKRSGKK